MKNQTAKNKFDGLAKGMAQSLTRPQGMMRFGVGLAGLALACFGPVDLASAQAPSGPDIQVNDPSLDNIQYPGGSHSTPWEFATESETTIATDGSNIVVSYNSAANQQITKVTGNQSVGTVNFTYSFIAGYSVSHDGGQTWRSSFISPSQG